MLYGRALHAAAHELLRQLITASSTSTSQPGVTIDRDLVHQSFDQVSRDLLSRYPPSSPPTSYQSTYI